MPTVVGRVVVDVAECVTATEKYFEIRVDARPQ